MSTQIVTKLVQVLYSIIWLLQSGVGSFKSPRYNLFWGEQYMLVSHQLMEALPLASTSSKVLAQRF